MLARVQNNGEFSDPFPVTTGVKQGCVLASTLFSMMFSAMHTGAFQDGDNGIPVRYRFNEKSFNRRRLQAKSKMQTEVLDEIFLLMTWQRVLQQKMQKRCGSNIWFKWQLWSHNQHKKDWGDISATIWKPLQPLQQIYHHSERTVFAGVRQVHLPWNQARFYELCTLISQCQAWQSWCAFGRLCGSIWDPKGSRLVTKHKVNRSMVCQQYYTDVKRERFYQRHATSI